MYATRDIFQALQILSGLLLLFCLPGKLTAGALVTNLSTARKTLQGIANSYRMRVIHTTAKWQGIISQSK